MSAAGDPGTFGKLVEDWQAAAEKLLGNQIPNPQLTLAEIAAQVNPTFSIHDGKS